MITRDDIRQLAAFQAPQGCAVSFYFQPTTPKDKSHREELILIKDLVRDALREAEKNGKHGCVRSSVGRILERAERLHGNHAHAKAIFACSRQDFWREFDLPPRLAGSRLFVNRHFHLRPLTAIADALARVCIVLVDRSRGRCFELWMDQIHEGEKMVTELSRRGRSDGFAGYQAGNAERHVDNEAMQHFKRVAEHLKELAEIGQRRFLVGCRDEMWPEIESHLHPYVKRSLMGHFAADPATATAEQVRREAERVLNELRARHRQALIREVLGEAHRNGRGALGLRRVLRSLETGEVQTLLLGTRFAHAAAECSNCGHLDTRMTAECGVCGHANREVEDVSDLLLSVAVRNGIEIVHVPHDPEFDKVGNVAALLRFRSDQSTEAKKAG
jgi:peptide subunit release factor 1 (eRF1)